MGRHSGQKCTFCPLALVWHAIRDKTLFYPLFLYGTPSGSLPQPLAARIISRTSAVGWHMPPRIGGVSGKPTDPPVVGFTSLTSAVGRLTPPRIGGGGGVSGN